MNSEYLGPENQRKDTKSGKEAVKSTPDKPSLEKDGPDKTKDPKVLHKDGSLADLPYNNQPGGGALEGTVGIGT